MTTLTFAQVSEGVVVNLVVVDALDDKTMSMLQGAVVPEGEPVTIGWQYDGATFTAPPPAPVSMEALTTEFTNAVQRHLDRTVKARGYDSIVSCASYATSTNATFAAEAAVAIAWRDAVWSYCYGELAKVVAGERPVPTDPVAFLAELPEVVW